MKWERIRRWWGGGLWVRGKSCIFADEMKRKSEKQTLAEMVADTVSRHGLLAPGDRVVVGLSGGADSTALLAVLNELGYDCIAAHCNFHLRGDESQRDMQHAEKICRILGNSLIINSFNVDARKTQHGESTEMACRELRYNWFEELIKEHGARAVAVGHHREDNVETFLLNLMRGTGIDGLRGMRYSRDRVIRPLLDASRSDIESYLADRGLDYVEDSSNKSDDYLRNRLRNHIIPEIKKYFDNAENAILSTMANVDEAGAIYDSAICNYRECCEREGGKLDLEALADVAGENQAAALFAMLKEEGVSATQCRDMMASKSKSGLKFISRKGKIYELDRGMLSVAAGHACAADEVYDVDLSGDIEQPVNIEVSRHDVSEFSPECSADVLYLDAGAISGKHRWLLRHRRTGDRIKPYGMRGSKAVSDLMSDAKFSAADKRAAWMLSCDDEIVWAVGLRASRHFTVTKETKEYIKLRYIKHAKND